MITLEQVKLLDQRITKTFEHIKKVTGENTLLRGKLESYQQRVDELEKVIKRFKDEQTRVEDGILSALDRLNQLEDVLEGSLAADASKKKTPPADEKSAPEQAVEPETVEELYPEDSLMEMEEEEISMDPLESPDQDMTNSQDSAKTKAQGRELDIF